MKFKTKINKHFLPCLMMAVSALFSSSVFANEATEPEFSLTGVENYLETVNDSTHTLSRSIVSLANTIVSKSDSLSALSKNASSRAGKSVSRESVFNKRYRNAVYDLSLDIPADTLMDVNMERDYPSFVKVVGEDNIGADSLLQQFALYSLDVNFKVNKTNIDPNNASYRKLIEEIVPIMKERNLQLHHMYVRMSASPEGSYSNNIRLAKGRGQALVDSLSRYIDMPSDDQIVFNTVPEDYAYLYKLIEASDDVDRDTIMHVIDAHKGDDVATKAALRALNGGVTWRRLLKVYYPTLRSARVVFYFTKYKLAEPEVVEGTMDDVLLPEWKPVFGTNSKFDLSGGTDSGKRAKEPMLAVKTNLLYDAFFIPGVAYDPIVNIEVEYYPHNSNWSFVGEYDFPWWYNDEGIPGTGNPYPTPYPTSKHHYFQLLNGQLEARRYFTTDFSHTGHYLSMYGHAFLYDFCFDSTQGRGYQGEGWGAGLGYGYVKRLGRNPNSRWKLEAFIKWGFFETRYDDYYYGAKWDAATGQFVSAKYYYNWHGDDVTKFVRRNHRFRSWFRYPTGAGITISYDLIDRKLKL